MRTAAPGSPRSSGYIPTLDGWRAIAVGMVCFAHSQPLTGILSRLDRFRAYGGSGVDLFFAISGLLICSRLLDEEKALGRISLIGFYLRRSFRILPAAYLYLATIASLSLARIIPKDWQGWWAAVLLYRNYLSAAIGETFANRPSAHFWSLSIEEHFYLVLPFLLVLFPQRRKLVLGLLLAASLGWLFCYLGTTPSAERQMIWIRRTDLHIWSLLFPAFLAVLLRLEGFRAWLVRYLRPYLFVAPFVLYGCYHLAHKLYFHIPSLPPAPASPNALPDTAFHPVLELLVPLLMPFLILSTWLHPSSFLSRLLELRPMRSIGRISYGIYLWQQIFFLGPSYSAWPLGKLPHLLLGILVLLCILLSYFLMEKPLVRLGHKLAPPITPGHRDLRSNA